MGSVVLTAILSRVTYGLLDATLPEFRLVVAIVSAALLALGISSFVSLALGYGRGERSRRSVLHRAESGQSPSDGAPMLASGVVRSLTTPLTAPFSGRQCVAYRYSIYSVHEHTITGRRISDEELKPNVMCAGYAARPFAVDGPSRRVRVLAVPSLEIPESREEGADVVARARDFLRATAFEPMSGSTLVMIGAAFDDACRTFTGEDEEVRRDWKREGSEIDPGAFTLEETVLPLDVVASVHGPWSSARGAIVSPRTRLAQVRVVAALGSPLSPSVASPGPRLERLGVGHGIVAYMITSAMLLALGAGLIWLANRLPSL